jgi:cell division protein FtsZ
MPHVKPDVETFARIKVVGVGGSGGNAVDHMVRSKVRGVEFIAVNTDAQDLHQSMAPKKLRLGKSATRGLGTGMNPEIGRQAAEESKEGLQAALKGADMVFVTCGMGGGTGTGGSPVIGQVARSLGALTIGVVTRPFSFEGAERTRIAETGLVRLRESVDAMITIPNDKLLTIVGKDTPFLNAFAICDEVLKNAVQGITDLITVPGVINVDFADVKAVMQNAGSALMGIGHGHGESRAVDAAKSAITSPLLDVSINGARGVLFAIAGGTDLTMWEIQEAAKIITHSVDSEAKIIFGAMHDDRLKKGDVRITVIASGFPDGMVGKSTSLFGATRRGQAGQDDVEIDVEKTRAPRVVGEPANMAPEPVNVFDIDKPSTSESKEEGDDSEWDAIPAFLRRKR